MQEPEAIAGFIGDERLVFQSIRDGDWDIYLVVPGNGGARRLTSDVEADMHPDLHPDGQSVVYSSDRHGVRQLYIVDLERTELHQLTFGFGSPIQPAWSPDGTRIAYVEYQYGHYNVFATRPDGLGVLCLTCGSGRDNFSPAWSPSGDRLAFVQSTAAAQMFRLWTVAADGEHPVPLTGPAWYLDNPAYAPDGASIAFDYAPAQDGSTRLARIGVNGGAITDVYDSGQAQVDAWMGCWSPDGAMLYYTRVEWVNQDGASLITAARLERIPAGGGAPERFPGDAAADMHPSLRERRDNLPPVSRVLPLPAYTRRLPGGVYLPIQVSDPGGSGVAGVYAQYRIGEQGAWSGLMDAFVPFAGPVGEAVYFRTQAWDRDGNWEAWPDAPDGDASTVFYAAVVTGTVSDARDTPLDAVQASFEPPAVAYRELQEHGGFTALARTAGAQQMRFAKAGYAPSRPMTISMAADQTVRAYLYPADEGIVNGHFDQPLGIPGGWQVEGTYPPQQTVGSDGQGRLVMRSSRLIKHALPEYYPGGGLYIDADGTVQLLWAGYHSTLYAAKPPTGTWPVSPATNLAAYDLQWVTSMPDGDGGMHMFYAVGGQTPIWHCHQPRSSLACGNASALTQDAWAATIAAAVDSDLGAHALWQVWGWVLYAYQPAGGAWTAGEIITASQDIRLIAADDTGAVHVVFRDGWTFRHMQKRPGDPWSSADEVYHDGLQCNGMPALAASPDGTLHFLYPSCSGQSVYLTKAPTQTLWLSQTVPVYTNHLAAGSDGSGALHLAAYQAGELKYYTRAPGAPAWKAHDFSSLSHVSYTRGGSAAITLQRADGRFEYVQFDERRLADYAAPRAAQAMTVRSDWRKPTLSFLYRASNPQAGNPKLVYTIGDGTRAVSGTLDVRSAEWAHQWLDVSSFSGAVVTVSFMLDDPALVSDAGIEIDEVSVGPWETPLVASLSIRWLDDNTPAVAVSISGINFAPTPTVRLNGVAVTDVAYVSETALAAVLPARLPPGTYDLRVTNPGGRESVLRGALLVRGHLYLPAIHR
jgi:TolB protein